MNRVSKMSDGCLENQPYVIGYEKRDHFVQKLDFVFAALR